MADQIALGPNSMLFGDKDRFAVEAILASNLTPHEAWGSSCVYVHGVQIGDIEEPHCGLGPFADTLREVAASISQLRSDRFRVLSDIEVFAFLHSQLFADDGQTVEEMRRAWEEFGRFSFLTNVGEQFDGWQTFVFSRDTESLAILVCGRDELPHAFRIEAREFVDVVRQFRSWFDGQIEVVA